MSGKPEPKKIIIPNEQFLRKRIRDLEHESADLRLQLQTRDENYSQVAAAISAAEPLEPFEYEAKAVGSKSAVVPVLQLSDFHIGEVVEPDEVEGYNAFNWDIARAAVYGLLDDFLRWVEIQREHYRISECVVLCQGDYVSGDIHDELRTTNEWPLPVQTAKAGWLLGEVFRILSSHFVQVTAYEVGADNHGRLQHKPQAKSKATNSMSFLVQFIANAAAERCKNFHPVVADGMKLLANINGQRFLLEHGDTIKAWSGIPLYGIQRAAGREAMRRMDGERGFDFMSIGHFHVPCWFERYLLMNGSLSGTSEFDHACGRHALPAQVAYLVHPSYGIFNFTPFIRKDVKDRLKRLRPAPTAQLPPEASDAPKGASFFRDRPCKACGSLFSPSSPTTRYCSSCLSFTCEQCKKVVKLEWYEKRRYCNPECAKAARGIVVARAA